MSNPARTAARLVAAWMLYLAAASQAAAGNFSVSPIRVDLSGAQPTAVVTVHNNDASPLLIQASTLAWSQPSGEESYADTRDLIATPPVFTLPPDGDQIIRVALRRGADPSRELSYRLLLAEVPQAARSGLHRAACRVAPELACLRQARCGREGRCGLGGEAFARRLAAGQRDQQGNRAHADHRFRPPVCGPGRCDQGGGDTLRAPRAAR